jgi:hypothetical protein
MHPFVMAIAAGTQLLTPVSDTIPKFNVEATCKGSLQADNEVGENLAQSFDKCMSDEMRAREQLGPIWSSYSPAVRTQCETEATIGQSSYVDLLTCMQMTGPGTKEETAMARKKKARD